MPSQVAINDNNNETTLRGRPSEAFSVRSHQPGTDATAFSTPMTKRSRASSSAQHLPMPIGTPHQSRAGQHLPPLPASPRSKQSFGARTSGEKGGMDDSGLLPASNPPKWGVFDVFPLSMFIKTRAKHGKETKGKKAARMRAKMGNNQSHNIPLEISLYLVSLPWI